MKKTKEKPFNGEELKDLSKIYGGGDSGTPIIKRELIKKPTRGRYEN